jgi:hypothetical protein
LVQHTTPSRPEQDRERHETTDASPLAIGAFAFGLALTIALVLSFLSWMFRGLENAAERDDPAQNPLAGDQTPRAPRLQTSPADDLAQKRRAEDERLSSYGWVDERRGVVRLPIERAIELLAERGFPEPAGTKWMSEPNDANADATDRENANEK